MIRLKNFVIDAAEFYHNQMAEEVNEKGNHSQPESVNPEKVKPQG